MKIFQSLFNKILYKIFGRYEKEEYQIKDIKLKLDEVSPSMCLAKWLQVSLHLTTGKTHSCYHPPVHNIDKEEILKHPSRLHNTKQKKEERSQMLKGERPKGCSYCWKIEDSGEHYSDRHYRSSEPWAFDRYKEVVKNGSDYDVIPSYMEVNFNQACQFKCSYCSPHLSTTWMDESKKFGAFPTIEPHNDIEGLKKTNLWPIPPKEFNPYVEAFWKWWPDLYPKLKVFRMTGGEPLLDPNTFKVLDYIEKKSQTDLELAITSNLCPPEKMMKRFQSQIASILNGKKIKRFMLFPSIDTWGEQAEYIRYGLNVEEFEKNVRSLLKSTPDLLMSFIVTVNALSLFNLKTLLSKFIEWEIEDCSDNKVNFRRIFFDLPYLRNPSWQSLDVLPLGLVQYHLKDCLEFMKKNPCDLKKKKFYGFSSFQINKMKRLIDVFSHPVDEKKQKRNRVNFYKFFKEHDHRRDTGFLKTFPELRDFWFECEGLALAWDREQAGKDAVKKQTSK